MNKKPLLDVLFTFYKRDTMRYVGKEWKSSGFLLLVGMCAYAAMFVTYPVNENFKSSYKNFYKPAIAVLPDFKLKDGNFIFEDKMPIEIKHPITKDLAFYINTDTNNLDDFPDNYHCYMSKDHILFPYIPFPILPSSQFWVSMIFKDLQEGKIHKGQDLLEPLNVLNSWSVPLSFLMSFLVIFGLELIKTLVITYIVMFMFRGGQVKKDFKMINRLCVLTYLPVLLVNASHMFFMEKVGIFTLIFLSFTHIILLMTAIAVNMDEGEGDKPQMPGR